jgi:hypothetical protein
LATRAVVGQAQTLSNGNETEPRLTPPGVISDAMTNKEVSAIRINSFQDAPMIDGVLDEVIWRNHPPYEGLHQVDPAEFAPATERTTFWVAYDDDHLYVAAQLYDEPDAIVALQPIQGKEFESDDQLHISLDPFNTDRDGYFFQTNPNGLRREVLIGNIAGNPDWQTIWDSAAQINEDGWAMEMAIPFKSLSFDPRNSVWGFNIGRVIRRKGEFQAWSSRGKDVWEMGPTVMADLSSIENVRQGLGLDVQLSGVLSQVDQQSLGSDFDAEPSVDIFYKPTPTITFAATINTDFSATEVDDRIVNLSRFDVLIPEKRDFFLSDSTQFSFAGLSENGMPFFSRTIGLSESGQPVPLDGGMKFFGRFGDYDIGAMVVRQEAFGEQGDDTDLVVVRGKRNIFRESALGFIYTSGNPLSDQDNEVMGVDFNYNNSNAFGNTQLLGKAWYLRVDEGLDLDDSHAHGVSLGYTRANVYLGWSHTEIGENFNPAMGFVNRRDIRRHHLETSYIHFFANRWIKSYLPRIDLEYFSDTENVKQTHVLDVTPLKFESVNGDQISLTYTNQFERLNEPFNPVSDVWVAPGDYEFERVSVLLSSAIARRFHASIEVGDGDFFDGDRFDEIYTLGWRPWRNWYATLEHEISSLDLPGGEFTTRLTRVGSELAISRNWAWLALAQYDNVTRELGFNSRLRWMPKAGRELSFVFNNLQERRDNNAYETILDDYRLKLTYTLRF